LWTSIAEVRRRFGYRRLHVLLKREGYLVNHKKLFRLYRERFRPAQRSVLLTLECALISLAELIDDLEFAVRKPLALPAFPTAVN
jgi:hypothetical protein